MTPVYSIGELLDRRTRKETTEWIADILSINYAARQISINIKGASGPRVVIVPPNLDIGTQSYPKIFAGNQAIIKRLDDRYIVTDFLSKPESSVGMPGGQSVIGSPTWL